jgi:hypothetical protein
MAFIKISWIGLKVRAISYNNFPVPGEYSNNHKLLSESQQYRFD